MTELHVDWLTCSKASRSNLAGFLFLEIHKRQHVYISIVADLEDLCHRIVALCATVTPDMLGNIWRELEYRLDISCAILGTHREFLVVS